MMSCDARTFLTPIDPAALGQAVALGTMPGR